MIEIASFIESFDVQDSNQDKKFILLILQLLRFHCV